MKNDMPQHAAAGKLTGVGNQVASGAARTTTSLWSPRASGVAKIATLLIVLSALLAAFVLSAAPASAEIAHGYLSQLTGFGEPTAVAFDGAGDVYVVDTAAKTVDRFSSAGVPLAFSASESYVEGSKLKGTPSGVFAEPDGVAVNDENGEVYVADGAAHVVDVFSSTGQYLSQLTGTCENLGETAVEPGACPGSVSKKPIPFEHPQGLAVDQVTHDLYVTGRGEQHTSVADVFSATGTYLSQFGNGVLHFYSESIAVNDLNEDAYVADSGAEGVFVFGSSGSFVPPEWRGASTPQRSLSGANVYVGLDQSNGHVYVAVAPGGSFGIGRVDEFGASASEEYLDQLTGTPTGPGGAPVPFGKNLRTVAVNPVNDDLYVADASGVIDVFSPDLIVPGTTVEAPSSVSSTAAVVGGGVNPAGVQVESCEFEYGTSTGYGLSTSYDQSESCEQTPAEIGKGAAEKPVSANLTSLQPNTTYYYRLNAANANGNANLAGLASGDGTFTTPGPPRIDSVSAEVNPSEKAGQTSATLHATIDPDGRKTTYQFEYGETTSYGKSVPISPAAIGSGEAPVAVPAVVLTGLKIGTTYHYRVLASNEYSATPITGLDQTFTTLGPLLIESEFATEVAATSATLGARINPLGTDTHYYFQYGTEDCATALVDKCQDTPVPPGTDIGSAESGEVASVPIQGLQPSTVYHYRVIATNTLGAVEGERNEKDEEVAHTFTTQGPGGPLMLPDGRAWELVSPAQKLGAQVDMSPRALIQASEGGSAISYPMTAPFVANPAGDVRLTQAISKRGGEGGGTWSTEDIATSYTRPSSIGEEYGEYRLFSADLSYALVEPFGDNPLVPGGEEGSTYVRDDNTGTYTLLTESEEQWYDEMVKRDSGAAKCETSMSPASGGAIVGESNDGCVAYFVSSAVLSAGGSSEAHNLYVAAGNSAGEWTVTFIAILSAGDERDWQPTEAGADLRVGTQTVEVSSDGRYLAFMSDRSLTGYDNRDESSGEPDEEVYRYHYESASAGGGLVCVSCNPSGARPAGWLEPQGTLSDLVEAWQGRWVAATIPGRTEIDSPDAHSTATAALYEPRYMLESGRLLFDSHDALVPQDVNGVGDVYEYESGGMGSCPVASGGCVALLSGGTGPEESAFADASVSGNDVFFVTAEKLVSQDIGNEYDMYDAHTCSAEVPCPSAVAVPPPCTTADSCKPAISSQPGIFGPSGSATFDGPGNPAALTSTTTVTPKKKTAAQIKTEKLTKALKACKKDKAKKKQATCEKRARKKDGAAKKAKKASNDRRAES
jgi:hypothetical protein